MNTGQDLQGMRKMQDLSRCISVAVLLLHIYYYCYAGFREWHLTSYISDVILVRITNTGLFINPFLSKLVALIFLLLSALGTSARKNPAFRYRHGLIWLSSGLILYFGSYSLLTLRIIPTRITMIYVCLTMIGYILILTGLSILSRIIASYLHRDFFHPDNGGFQQQEQCMITDYSINLPAKYKWKGQTRKSYINFINARRGVLIMGSPGSGKSWFIIEPVIRQLIAKGFALFIYDFKYDHLTRLAYQYFQQYKHQYPSSAAFYYINFTDLSRSHRCNLLAPSTLEWLADAIGASRTILLSMNKTWVNRQGEFFVESPINFLAALIWWLRQYHGGQYCTLPHVIELAQVPYDKLFTLLRAEPSIHTLIATFIDAYQNKTMELIDSQIASARIPLGRLASPDLYYILMGNDCTLEINDPAAPKILCLGGDPPRQEALAPVLSLYIDRLNKLINRSGRHRSALICDEFATVRAASVMTTVATARSNNIIPVLAVQDLSQLRTQYSREEADLILNITGNLIVGQVGGETARWVSERFPGTMQYKTVLSLSDSGGTSISKAEQPSNPISPAIIATLSSGEFVGITADDPGQEQTLKAFHARITKDPTDISNISTTPVVAAITPTVGAVTPTLLPVIHAVSPQIVEENFQRVKTDIQQIIAAEMQRIKGDPALSALIVKK